MLVLVMDDEMMVFGVVYVGFLLFVLLVVRFVDLGMENEVLCRRWGGDSELFGFIYNYLVMFY